MGQSKKQSFLHGALILSAAAILVKVIGALFKIPLSLIDSTAFGYFDTAYSIYVPIYTIAIAGFPIAVSRMVSESLTLGRYRDVRVIYRVALKIFFFTGTLGTLVMLVASFIYPNFVHMPNARATMLVMSPAILFCCIVSAHRGLYEGTRNMYPTAVSQVIEALGKLIIGLGLAYGALYVGQWQFAHGGKVYGQVVETAAEAVTASLPYVAAGGMAGVTIGSLFALLYMMALHHRRGDGITREELRAAPRPRSTKRIFRALLAIAVPVVLGSLATQLTNIIDVVSLQKCLAIDLQNNGDVIRGMFSAEIAADKTQDVMGWLIGKRGIAMTYVNLVPNITLTFGISALPVVTAAWASKDRRQLKTTVASVLRVTLLIAMPAGVGLSVLGKPIMHMIYGQSTANISGPMLQVLGIAVIFICLIAPINALLQAVGRADLPAKIILVGGAVKLLLNIVLVLQPRLNIMGSAYSTLACYTVMVLLSLIALRRVIRVRYQVRAVFLKPLVAALCCGAAAWSSHGLLTHFGLVNAKIATVLAIGLAAVVYVVALLLLKTLTREDVLMLPKGQKIAQILEKHDWIG